jgi:hypothetical protein
MADSTIALKDVENWIQNEFLSKKYHQAFAKRKLGVQSGGVMQKRPPLNPLLSKEGTSVAQGWWIKQ